MSTRGLENRKKKEAIRQGKAEQKKVAAFESVLIDIFPRLGDIMECKGGYFYTDIFGAEKLFDPVTDPDKLKQVFETIAGKAKDAEVRDAFAWVAGFQTNEKATDFLRYISPQAFKTITPP